MKKFKWAVEDIINIIILRFKLLMSNKMLVLIMALFLVTATTIISTFFVASRDNSSIPIGIVDMDNTSHSKLVIQNLKNAKLLRTTVGNKDELLSKMKKGELNAVFIIKSGLADNIENERYSKIIEAFYVSDTKYAKLLSDVVLSCMLDDICYYYARNIYYNNKVKLDYVFTEEEYEQRLIEQYNTQEETIGFDFDVVNIKNKKSVNDKIDTTLLYRQIVIGIIALILLVIGLLLGNIIIDDYKNKVTLRIGTTNVSDTSLLIGDILGMWTILGVFVIGLSVLLIDKINMITLLQKLKFILIMVLFVGTISMIFVFITRLVKEEVVYQLISTGVILILGGAAAGYILGFLIDERIVAITKYTPFGILINSYKNISLNNSIKNNIIGYVFTIIVIYLITYIIQKIKGDRINCES